VQIYAVWAPLDSLFAELLTSVQYKPMTFHEFGSAVLSHFPQIPEHFTVVYMFDFAFSLFCHKKRISRPE
jgi:hypothetical protein